MCVCGDASNKRKASSRIYKVESEVITCSLAPRLRKEMQDIHSKTSGNAFESDKEHSCDLKKRELFSAGERTPTKAVEWTPI